MFFCVQLSWWSGEAVSLEVLRAQDTGQHVGGCWIQGADTGGVARQTHLARRPLPPSLPDALLLLLLLH